jgi:hypothetical protein
MSSKDDISRVYLQIPMEPEPRTWIGSQNQLDLIESYETGKFGNWGKPGLRKYLKENETEVEWRRKRRPRDEFEETQKVIKQNPTIFVA